METKMKKATEWDASEYLETEADIAAYLNAALEDGGTSVIAAALGDIARVKGMTQLQRRLASRAMVFIRRCPLRGTRHLIRYRKL